MDIFLNPGFVIGHMNYWLFVVLMMTGLYIVVARGNLLKKIVGLNVFQTSVFLLYISMGKVAGGTAPIATGDPSEFYSNPLPHVLILTAIVVGIATTALGLAIILRISETYGSIEEDDVLQIDNEIGRSELDEMAKEIDGPPKARRKRAKS